MTREEAVEVLKERYLTCVGIGLDNHANRVNEAIDMAIEALQAEYEDYEHATLVDIKEPLVKHDRDWIIGCIKHDGFIKTDRFDEANQIILDALQFAEHFDLLKEHESLQEVVRCKDCRWYENRYGKVCHNPRYGDGHANYSPPYVDEEYFYKDGERRTSR